LISFASSIWLWAMAGIIIPLLIHLWNVRKGKTLKVGSISFFSETPVSRARSLQLTDLLLLMIRCLVFILLSVFIAQPLLSSAFSSNQKGWLLLEKNTIHAAYQQYGKEIDSMLDRGVELHELGGDFAEIKLSDSTKDEQGKDSYWELLRQLEKKIPVGLPVTLYTENRLARFDGTRPPLSLNLNWKTVNTDRTSNWIEQAYTSYDDSIITITGRGIAEETAFSRLVLPLSDPMVKRDPLRVQFENDTSQVDTNTLHVSIYTDTRAKDGQYLLSAIEAAKEFTKRKIVVGMVKDTVGMKGADWLFWLSDRKIPSNARAKNIFMYAGGNSQPVASHFSPGNDNILIPVYKLFNDSIGNAGITIWQTGLGQSVLTRLPNTNDLVFHSRLDPKWNGLVWSERFPQMVIQLLYPVQPLKGRDYRMIDSEQFMPMEMKDGHSHTPVFSRPIDHWFWLMAFALFLAERLLAYRKQKLANG
jgi:hypothetical protein